MAERLFFAEQRRFLLVTLNESSRRAKRLMNVDSPWLKEQFCGALGKR
jgi:hypothetical protein